MSIKAKEHFISGLKIISQMVDPQVSGPNVVIQPIEPMVQKAVDILKRFNSNYFSGISKIVVNSSTGNFGFVESGPDKDHTVLNINLNKLKNLTSPEEILFQTVLTIAHEAAHTKSFKDGQFIGGEVPAENEERKIANWLNSNPNVLVEFLKKADLKNETIKTSKIIKITKDIADKINFESDFMNGKGSFSQLLSQFNFSFGKKIKNHNKKYFLLNYFKEPILNCCIVEDVDNKFKVIPFNVVKETDYDPS